MITKADLERAEKLAAEATEGPWVYGKLATEFEGDFVVWKHRGDNEVAGSGTPQREYVGNIGPCIQPLILTSEKYPMAEQIFEGHERDAAFIAEFRTLGPVLVAEVQRLRRELAKALIDEASYFSDSAYDKEETAKAKGYSSWAEVEEAAKS